MTAWLDSTGSDVLVCSRQTGTFLYLCIDIINKLVWGFFLFFVPLSFASFLFIFSITLQICFAHPSEYLAVYKIVKIDYHFFNILDNYRNMLEMIQFG